MERAINKEVAGVQKALNSLPADSPTEKVVEVAQSCHQSLSKLKAEYARGQQRCEEFWNMMEARLSHVDLDSDPGSADKFASQRLDRLVADYLLRGGYYNTALQLTEEAGIKVFEAAQRIEEDIKAHSCQLALQWCAENRSRLKKLKCDLEFHLRLQEFVMMLEAAKPHEAILYAKKHLVATEEPYFSLTIRAVGLLAFYNNTESVAFRDHRSEMRWPWLVEQFRMWNFRLYGVTVEPPLCLALHAGLIALQTPACHLPESSRNPQCPTCFEPLRCLAEPLPMAHQRSRLVCRISGAVMDEENPPMVLPNGRVYSLQALEEMALRNGGTVTDPQTDDTFTFSQLSKAFIT